MQEVHKHTRYQNKCGLCFTLANESCGSITHLGAVMLIQQQPIEDTCDGQVLLHGGSIGGAYNTQ